MEDKPSDKTIETHDPGTPECGEPEQQLADALQQAQQHWDDYLPSVADL